MNRRITGFCIWLWCFVGASAEEVRTFQLQSQGHNWSYALYVPHNLTKPAPLVLIFHGAGGDGLTYLVENQWISLSQEEGVIVAAPNGLPANLNRPANFLTNPRVWNSGQLAKNSSRTHIDDVAFVADLLNDISKRVSIDARRVFAAGHSNGAGMTYRLGAAIPDRFSALATVMGQNYSTDVRPLRGVSMMSMIGTADPLNPIAGGERWLPWGRGVVPPPFESFNAWARSQGCNLSTTKVRDDIEVRIDSFSPCRDNTRFEVWSIKGQGHGWPGGGHSGLPESLMGPKSTRVRATMEIWKFFSSQP